MKIAFYKAWKGDWVDKLISIVTFSKYSHCELVFPNGECASSSARDGGIRFKHIDMDSNWDVFDINEFADADEHWIRRWFIENGNDTYHWAGAIGSVFGIDIRHEDKKYCSYACAFALRLYPVVTPRGLYEYLRNNKLIEMK